MHDNAEYVKLADRVAYITDSLTPLEVLDRLGVRASIYVPAADAPRIEWKPNAR